ncbi:T9SS type A sorting domain-containing protein [Flavilitoribacter nigricans]|nr:T9SS type A sorting domain-containing protein [Flavilitoribacter nigricans]
MQSKLFTQITLLLLTLGSLPMVAQTPFFTYDFSDETASLSDWTGGGENEGTETWKWSADPSRGGFLNFAAPTASNGYLYFDSDANGLNEHAVTLTSPIIDCSGQNQVFLEMYTQYVFYINDFSTVELGVSVDGGDFVYQDILEEVEAGNVFVTGQRVVAEIPDAINQSNVQIQIKWTGFFEYFLHIDDVALYNTAPILANDLAIRDVRHPSAYTTPLSQVDSMFFLGIAENIGADPQTNTHLRLTILDPEQNQVFQDSSDKTDMLAAGALDTLIIEQGFVPEAIGNYFVFESVVADEDDDFTGNNREIFTFEVSEDEFAVDDGDLQNVAAPAELNGDFWEGGNLYYVPNGAGYEAHEARFSVWSSGQTHIGKTATILLYKVAEDDEPGFTNSDVELVAFSSYTFQEADENFELINAPIYQDDGFTQGVALEDSTDYILLISLPEDIAIPYTYRNVIYDVSSVVRNGTDWFLGGFTGPIALVVRLGIREAEDPNAVQEPELADSRISSFPNPARDFYRINLDLENSSAVQLQLMSISGQIVMQREYAAIQQDRIDLDVSDLPAGAYLVKIRTEEGVKTLKLTKQ